MLRNNTRIFNQDSKKMKYTFTDVILPSLFIKRKANVKIFDNFEQWLGSILSLETILQSNLEMEILKKELKLYMETDNNPNLRNNKIQLTRNDYRG